MKVKSMFILTIEQTGVGGDTSWGLLPMDEYQLKARDMKFDFMIKL